ncbi:hypothetical protein Srot_1486 [Segniliparus rotundus DSM 44985]|uniref:Uncharacterized protein n=1 Tax=Segniliparus rotundus (strain ATCC BAA-972 / CDC 1076 / CIP 108378 / DSM 44985 / JCM 13578) TaxID=640132 RepID=D6Z7L9_SEGRD|nr:LmeA family phospholipid-binding protein [Segniliparus rotundus]ADG97949.1 hypothetical protein Srot_1486 [Segniliparus rotundus DSM 44985]
MSHPNDSDPNKPAQGRLGEEPAKEKPHVEDDATTELPAAGRPPAPQEDSEATAVIPGAAQDAADETSVLPAVEQDPSVATTEFPAPVPADATAELSRAEQDPSVATAEFPAADAAASAGEDAPGSAPDTPRSVDEEPSGRSGKGRLKTVALSLVVLLLLGVVGVLGGEVLARHLLAVCAEEAAKNILNTEAKVDYDHNKFLLASLIDHEIPYLAVEAKNSAVDKYNQHGQVELKEAIKGLDVSARMDDIHVVKDGGSVGHMTAQAVWTADGIRQTLANPKLKDPNQTRSPITSVNAVTLDQLHNQFSVDVNGTIGVLQARAVIVVKPEIDKQHNLQIHIQSIDLPDFRKIGIDVSGVVNSMARPAIEQVAGKIASYPMGLKAKSVQVKHDSIVFQFYAENAPLVKGTKCSALRPVE